MVERWFVQFEDNEVWDGDLEAPSREAALKLGHLMGLMHGLDEFRIGRKGDVFDGNPLFSGAAIWGNFLDRLSEYVPRELIEQWYKDAKLPTGHDLYDLAERLKACFVQWCRSNGFTPTCFPLHDIESVDVDPGEGKMTQPVRATKPSNHHVALDDDDDFENYEWEEIDDDADFYDAFDEELDDDLFPFDDDFDDDDDFFDDLDDDDWFIDYGDDDFDDFDDEDDDDYDDFI